MPFLLSYMKIREQNIRFSSLEEIIWKHISFYTSGLQKSSLLLNLKELYDPSILL